MAQAIAGRRAKIRVGVTPLNARKWTWHPFTDMLDTTSFETDTFADYIGGIQDSDYTVEGWYAADANMFDNPPRIRVAQVLTGVKLYINDVAGPFVDIPSSVVADLSLMAEARGLVDFTFQARGKGAYQYPQGNTVPL